MNKSGIDWTDMTWNPITGCLHGCPYCYAIDTMRRYCGECDHPGSDAQLHELFEKEPGNIYPFGFEPTFHRYRLADPARLRVPHNVFCESMGELFGDWVPDEWIEHVLTACSRANWHRYLFLTKNPHRYFHVIEYLNGEDSPLSTHGADFHFGASVTNDEQFCNAYSSEASWISIEPLLERLDTNFLMRYPVGCAEEPRWKWVVIGAETGRRKDKVTPRREWVEEIVAVCRRIETPVFMKRNIAGVWGDEPIQETPWEDRS